MKKAIAILGNVLIVLALIIFVFVYAGNSQRDSLKSRTEAFLSMTSAMERVTEIYLTGEQRVCNSWANYINANPMTGEEAVAYVRAAVTSEEIMGHLIYTDEGDSLSGLSTAPRGKAKEGTDPFAVSYETIFEERFSEYFREGNAVNVTKSYTNPINGKQSIAFCQFVTLREEGEERQAVLLRVIPLSVFRQEWVFPTGDYPEAQTALLDAGGDYIIHENAFKNSNFYEFYQSYNPITPTTRTSLQQEMTGEPGYLEMRNSKEETCIAAHVRVGATDSWTLVSLIPAESLGRTSMDWGPILVISGGLLALMAIDLVILIMYSRRAKKAAEEAERANRAKTDFLSTMSHDIRTPMNAVIGLTQIAEKHPEDTAAVRENLHKIRLASNHLLTLINDILDISKVESGRLTLNPVRFSIVESAENLMNISRPMVREKNIDFNFRINRFEYEYLYADQLRLNQILINLLSNAIKYTEPGGNVSVDLREEPGSSAKTVRLTYVVADTGIGMTPEFMKRMYEPFSRQTDSRVNSIQGTGLGLAITRQMVNLMQGQIDCQSAPGKGTTFTVTLELPKAEQTEEKMMLPAMRALIVDDDPVLLETAKDTLQSIGVQADTAGSGGEAVARVKEEAEKGTPYRVVILDWKMPDMDGIETSRRIRGQCGADVPILLISAYDEADLPERSREAGISGFVSKPLFRSTLYHKLSEVLSLETEPRAREEDYSDVAGMNILVAEDNDINWEIISTLLGMYGITAERAENGQIAVDRMREAKPDEFQLVFMDIRMPVMNGLNATRAIRSLPDPRAARIPIIAMTADAFSENVSECLAAGMNGHLAKPIDVKLVLKEIRKIREAAT